MLELSDGILDHHKKIQKENEERLRKIRDKEYIKELEKEVMRLRQSGYDDAYNTGYRSGEKAGYLLALFDVKHHTGKHDPTDCLICAGRMILSIETAD